MNLARPLQRQGEPHNRELTGGARTPVEVWGGKDVSHRLVQTPISLIPDAGGGLYSFMCTPARSHLATLVRGTYPPPTRRRPEHRMTTPQAKWSAHRVREGPTLRPLVLL